jgi:hypothetical protein
MSDEIIIIDGWRLRRNVEIFGDDEAHVQVLDIGKSVGLSRERDVRRGVRAVLDKYPNDSGLRACHARSSGGRTPSAEWWANEEGALLLVMEFRTPKANEIRRALVRVFVAWRNGRLHAANRKSFDESAQAWLQAEFERRWTQYIGTHYSTPTGSITAYQHSELMRARKTLAVAMVDAGVAPSTRSALRSIDNALQSHTGWGSRAKPWIQTPLVLLSTVHFHLRDLTMQLDKMHPVHTRKSRTRQLPLKLVTTPGANDNGDAADSPAKKRRGESD